MDDSSPSKRNPRGFWGQCRVYGKKVINNVKASGIKIVEGGSKRKVINSDSEEIEYASLDLDKSEEHHERHVFA
ncbi:hypothetical protein H5410_058551 [Solanum commersonii]|uniref:Uncharacterized protein n=1 Tax=Solanum commersonii TaxID=4109 RepID=A0A9J5WRE9_SOLCO|nr:hypothetical protein H5410_058551 [Solanum commersonii]